MIEVTSTASTASTTHIFVVNNMQDVAVVVVLSLALVFANMPFFTRKFFGFWHFKSASKSESIKTLAMQIIELIAYYFVVGVAALGLEWHLGQIAPQQGFFYAITFVFFVVLAFPGFTYRYLYSS